MPSQKRKRQSYSFELKLRAIAQAEEKGNRAAAREFQVDESMIRDWRKKKLQMKKLPKRQRTCRGGKAKFLHLERTLKDWVISQRESNRAVTTVMIRLKAKDLSTQMNLVDFVGGPSWCHRFMRRNRLSVRTRTTVGQKLPDDWEEKVVNFRDFVKRRKTELKVDGDKVFNMDEVPMSFDAPLSRTVDAVGAETVPITTTGHEKTSFTVVLACSETGKKLKPMVIFKRKTIPKEKLCKDVVVHCQKKGWMDCDGMEVWAEKVWKKRPVSIFNRTSLLIFDSFTGHIDEGVRNNLKKIHKTTTAVIPGGLTKKLQPLDISVNRAFKSRMRDQWEQWMSAGIHTFTESGKMRRATYTEVCEWVSQAWDAVPVTAITNGFRKAGIDGVDLGLESDDSDDDDSDDDDDDVESRASNLPRDMLALFNSDSEDEEFEGF